MRLSTSRSNREKIHAVIIALLVMLIANRVGNAVELSGKVLAVDSAGRWITIERDKGDSKKPVTLDVADSVLAGKELALGTSVTLDYDPESEVITKIVGGGTEPPSGNDEMAQVIPIQELDAAGHEDQPWVTPDGLTFFWTTQKPGEKKQVWSAFRTSPQLLFGNKKQVTIGQDNTFTADALEGIVFLPQEGQGNLCVVKRPAIVEPFSRPAVMQEFPASIGFLAGPSLSDDGNTLYLERLGEGTHELLVSTRKQKDGKWSPPTLLPITASKNPRRWPHVSTSGKYLICTEPNAEKKGVLTVYRREAMTEPFAYMGIVQVDGKQLPGRFGRYVEATKELFFSRVGKDNLEIAVLRPFDPERMVKPE